MSEPRLNIAAGDDVCVVGFEDDTVLDALTTPPIARQLYELVEKPGSTRLLLDFANVCFLSSQALGVLLTLRRKAERAAVRLAATGLRPELQRVFQVTKLDTMFPHFAGREEARAYLTQACEGS